MLVGPAATARLLTRRMAPMMLTATAVAAGAVVAGLYASYHARVAAGAAVTLALVGCFLLALLSRWALQVTASARPQAVRS